MGEMVIFDAPDRRVIEDGFGGGFEEGLGELNKEVG